jgi:2-ketocyclohexanecarboxyl-CoA hydrolase
VTELTDVQYEVDAGLATITIDRPDRMNAFRARTVDELIHCFKRAWADAEVGVVCLTGAGDRAFCTGGDQKQRAETGDYGPSESGLFEVEHLHRLIREIPKPVIAAVNGYAFAAGLETALLADIRIAAENAEFGALERRWNIVGGDGLTIRLPLVVGYARAMELIITGRRIDAREAERIGLVNEVVPKGQSLARAQALAHEIAALPQGAIRSDKETVIRAVGRPLEERLRIEAEATISMFMRRDLHTIGAAAFKAGRKPEWPHHGL